MVTLRRGRLRLLRTIACDDSVTLTEALGLPLRHLFSRDEALGELLAHSAGYNGSRSDIVPYAKELVSWPAEGGSPVGLSGCLSSADQEWFGGWRRHMLRSEEDARVLFLRCLP